MIWLNNRPLELETVALPTVKNPCQWNGNYLVRLLYLPIKFLLLVLVAQIWHATVCLSCHL